MKDYSGPAFPVTPRNGAGQTADTFLGVTMRDYFAAAALPAVIAAYVKANGRCIGTDHIPNNSAVIAWKFADAMIASREKD